MTEGAVTIVENSRNSWTTGRMEAMEVMGAERNRAWLTASIIRMIVASVEALVVGSGCTGGVTPEPVRMFEVATLSSAVDTEFSKPHTRQCLKIK